MTTIATLFSGGEGVGVGARTAGLTHLWGVEYDEAIANVARLNGFHIITTDVMTVDPHTLEIPDVLHASPVCKRASVANQSAELNEDGTKEAPEDIAAGEKIAQFIDIMQPKVFTLENVFQYRNFKAFKIICNALNQGGYMWDFDNLNAADYGVPQTRRRLILRAIKGRLLPNLPQPERWVGWYEAIEDLIPYFCRDVSAPWLKRVIRPYTSRPCFMAEAHNMARSPTILLPGSPAMTIVGNLSRRPSHYPSLWIDGQGKHISIKSFARLQSVPDKYQLPNSDQLAGLIIANMVPPLLYQKIVKPLAEAAR